MATAFISAGCRPEIVNFVIAYTCPSQSQATVRENSELILVCVLVFTLNVSHFKLLTKMKTTQTGARIFLPQF